MKDWFEHILFHTRAQPQKPALVMEDRVVTYGMLGTGIERCARRIAAAKLDSDNPVAVMVGNPIRHLTLCLALHRAGVPSVSLERDQAHIVGPALAAVLGDRAAMHSVAPGNRIIQATDEWFGADAPDSAVLPLGFSSNQDISRISLTSGSTGAPSRVPHSVEGVGQRILEKILGCVDASRTGVLCLPGLSSILGFSTSLATLTAGRTLYLAEQLPQAIRMIELYSIDVALMSTEQLLDLTRVARKMAAGLASLRAVWIGGSTATRPLLEAATTYVCRDIFVRYGVSEVGMLARTTARALLAEPTLVGDVAPGVEVAAFDAQGHRLPPGETGILKRRRDSEDGAPWIELGDIGWVTADRKLHVAGRIGEAEAGARGLSPIHEIEHLVRLTWDVDGAAAILHGAGDTAELWVGTFSLTQGFWIKPGEVEALARRHGIRHPIKEFSLPNIPRGINGKVNREQVKEQMLRMAAASR